MHRPFTYSRNEFNARFLFFPTAVISLLIKSSSSLMRRRCRGLGYSPAKKVQPSKLTIAQTSQNPKDIAAKDS
jgi:hypothetical protein